MKTQVVIGTLFSADDKYIYNNTIFNCWYGFGLLVKNNVSPECSAEGNAIFNNCIRRNAQGADNAILISWARDADYGGRWVEWRLPEVQVNDSGAWGGSIGNDPLLRSESPKTSGLTNDW